MRRGAVTRTRRTSGPTPAELAAAADRTVPDVIGPGLRVLFCGINPGLYSAATGYHFARPGNRFWPALYEGGFTGRQFRPDEQDQLLRLGLGITNIVARATARADQLSTAELREGGGLLRVKASQLRPFWLAIVGITAYRIAFSSPDASIGPQDAVIEGTRLWVLPNPSGLNAHWNAASLAAEFGRLRAAAS